MEKLPTTDLSRMKEAMDSAQMHYEITTDDTFGPGGRHDGGVLDLGEYASIYGAPADVAARAATAIEIAALDALHLYDSNELYLGSAAFGDRARYVPRGESLVKTT